MDLFLLKEKINEYHTTAEVFNDILWIQHNCLIVGNIYSFIKKNCINKIRILSVYTYLEYNSTKRAIARRFVDFCKQEIFDINSCIDCYVNANSNDFEWFSKLCPQMHPVVWAKVSGYQYEPAKVMKVQNDQIEVYFFGTHTAALIPPKWCFCFSNENPNKSQSLHEDINNSTMKVQIGL